ncbi:hypothetical protein FOZ60_007197 [Perkinsus olseni]|uniref:Uncharacterized protein n=1 Tax=Perkinsus olseni TaxID=32597 RepID=A0A7J6PEY0_PEROL|nr:hypothetical protein FOZ60_007197 [Perkinsus olseni]
MAGRRDCSQIVAKCIHYSASGLLILLGAFYAVTSLYFLSQSIGHPLGTAIGLGFGLVVCATAVAGLFVNSKRKVWYLLLLLLMQALAYLCFFAVAVIMSIFMPSLTGMDQYTMAQLNFIAGRDGSFYRGTRTVFLYVYKHAGCFGGECTFRDAVDSCTLVECNSSKDLSKSLNDLLGRRPIGPGYGSSMSRCMASAIDDADVTQVMPSSVSVWCGCSTEIFRYMRLWSPWILASLWLAVFLLFLVAATTLKTIFMKRIRWRASVIRSVGQSVGRSEGASMAQPEDVEFGLDSFSHCISLNSSSLMASCCEASSHFLNYLAATIIFVLGGLLVAASIYLFVAYAGAQLIKQWPLWISLFVGAALLIVALVGCGATYKYNRCLLLSFLSFASLMLIVLIALSIAVTIYGDAIHSLGTLDTQQLLHVTGQEATAYSLVRSSYLGVYDQAHCSGGLCEFQGPNLVCSEVRCKVGKVGDVFYKWLRHGPRGLTPELLAACLHETAPHASTDAASAWCVSDTVIFEALGKWGLASLIALWVITVFVALLVISNTTVLCRNKRKREVYAQAVQIEAVRDFHSLKV